MFGYDAIDILFIALTFILVFCATAIVMRVVLRLVSL